MAEKIFISYNHKDELLIDTIVRRLAIEFGKDNIFYDKWSMQPGDSIVGKMNEGLHDCTVFFVFLSPNSLSSNMVGVEWQAALHKSINKNLKYVAVKIAECEVPEILAYKEYINLYGEGLDSAIEKMKAVIRAENNYKPLEEAKNIIAYVHKENEQKIIVTIKAEIYNDPNPIFTIFSTNESAQYTICYNISDSPICVGNDTLTLSNGKQIHVQTAFLQRTLKPGFPFVSEITCTTEISPNEIVALQLVDNEKGLYKALPVKIV